MSLALDPDPAAAPFGPEHATLRSRTRQWVGEALLPHADEWEAAREFPRSVYAEAGRAGVFGWKYAPADGGLGPDLIADVVVAEELARCGSGGVAAGLGAQKDLAPYYVSRFGSPEQREQWLRPAITGESVAGLSVTEPSAGSDVASLRCRARQDGGDWVLRGEKTFCTNGARADWVLVAARTSDEPGAHAVSLLIVPTDAPGFSASRIPTLGWRPSQTGLLALDDVRVPAEAMLGAPGDGFPMIMQSFQWERICLAVASLSAAAASLSLAAVPDDPAWMTLVRRLLAARALTYAAVASFIAGGSPLREVSAAKWLACDLDVDAAVYRLGRVAPGSPEAVRAERAVRDARLGPIGGGAREVMAELVARTLAW